MTEAEGRDVISDAFVRWFHGTDYTMRGHDKDPEDCGHCAEAADVAALALTEAGLLR